MQVMECLAGKPSGCSFSAIQQSLGSLSAPTVSRLLKVLVDSGWVQKIPESGWYSVADGFLLVANAAMGNLPREAKIQPVLDSLAHRTGESAAFFEIRENDFVLLAKSEQQDSVHYRDAGGRNRAFVRNPFSRVILSRRSREQQIHYFNCAENPERITQSRFLTRLQALQKSDIWVDDGEHMQGVIRIMAPVSVDTEGCVGAIGISLPRRELSGHQLDHFKQQVIAAAQQAEGALEQQSYGQQKGQEP